MFAWLHSSQGLANIKSAERLKGRADADAWLTRAGSQRLTEAQLCGRPVAY